VGDVLNSVLLVTGCIIAVMGTENANGELEVIDLKFADLAPQPDRWALSKPPPPTNGSTAVKKQPKIKGEDEDVEMAETDQRPGGNSKIAIVSGLEFSGSDTSYAMELNLLLEFLLGEALDPAAQAELAHISRLIIAGNSIAADHPGGTKAAAKDQHEEGAEKKLQHKKYGYDSSSYNPLPSQLLDEFLAELLPSMPVTLLPGATDPANASYPQQPVHSAMFPQARSYAAAPGAKESKEEPGWLDVVTNPWEGEVDGWRVLGTGGQNVDDIFRYVDSNDRLGMMEAMCRWRCSAPTAPDTLCKPPQILPVICSKVEWERWSSKF
jgi:DNA polymerase delta subunit 2